MSDLTISRELAQAVVDYLVLQPYREVAPLVEQLARLEEIPEREELRKVAEVPGP